ncbi:stage II sporulation protein M [Mucilaginibacter sp.]
MRESLFIKQNADKWKVYETKPASDPDEIAERFVNITDDLAYSKTFYPKSRTTSYLNNLAAGFHQSIYKNKKEHGNRVFKFWKHELPLLFRQYHRQLLYSFLFFMVFFFIGWISAKYDKNFVRLILGDDYVNMTNANIAKHDPFGVYKDGNSSEMFLMIVSNNLYVTVLNYISGILVSLGTLVMLFQNGIMLGSFEYLFVSHGLGIQSVLVIFIHGTLEISSLIIAGGAGLVFGNSILFPKTYKRILSFKKGALDGLKITIGVLPIIVVAAIFESFVTRHTEMPIWLSILILTASLLFIIWYAIIYPIQLTKKLKNTNPNAGKS